MIFFGFSWYLDCEQSLIFLCHQIRYYNITSWFAITLAEIRTRRILREKADLKRLAWDHALSLLSLCLSPRAKEAKKRKKKITPDLRLFFPPRAKEAKKQKKEKKRHSTFDSRDSLFQSRGYYEDAWV